MKKLLSSANCYAYRQQGKIKLHPWMKVTKEEILSSHLYAKYFTLVRGTPEHLFPGALSSGVPSIPCNTKLPHTALPHSIAQTWPDIPPQPWHIGTASHQSSTGHLATCRAADCPHVVPTASTLPAAYPIHVFVPLFVADTLSKSPSPVKGAPLSSTLELGLHSRHQAQARAKQYQVSEVRWMYVARHCRGWLSSRQRADEAKTIFMLALNICKQLLRMPRLTFLH